MIVEWLVMFSYTMHEVGIIASGTALACALEQACQDGHRASLTSLHKHHCYSLCSPICKRGSVTCFTRMPSYVQISR